MPKRVRSGFLIITLSFLVAAVLCALAVPYLLRRRIVTGSEGTAPQDLCAIRKAVKAYIAEHGEAPLALSSLQGRVRAPLSCDASACDYRHYRFQYTASTGFGKPRYPISAQPVRWDVFPRMFWAGSSYYLDETGVLRCTEEDRAATMSDPPLSAMLGSCKE